MKKEMKSFNYRSTYSTKNEIKGETNTMPSMTIPNEAMSIREILIRYSRGLPIDGKVPIYDEENDLPDPRKMDLADWEELQIKFRKEIDEIKTAHQKQLEAENKAKEQELEEYKQFKEQLRKSQSNQQSNPQSNQ